MREYSLAFALDSTRRGEGAGKHARPRSRRAREHAARAARERGRRSGATELAKTPLSTRRCRDPSGVASAPSKSPGAAASGIWERPRADRCGGSASESEARAANAAAAAEASGRY